MGSLLYHEELDSHSTHAYASPASHTPRLLGRAPHRRESHAQIVGASLSEPHIDEKHMRELFGASLSEPHIDGKHMRELFIYI